jgi:hypothetical protein
MLAAGAYLPRDRQRLDNFHQRSLQNEQRVFHHCKVAQLSFSKTHGEIEIAWLYLSSILTRSNLILLCLIVTIILALFRQE